MLKNNILVLVLLIFLIRSSAIASAVCGPGDRDKSQCTSAGIPKTADNGSGIQDQAKNAQDSNAGGSMLGQMGTMIGAGFAAANTPPCFSPPPGTPPECSKFAMGLAGAAAGMMLSGDHGAAGAGAVNSGNAATVGGGSITADNFNSKLPTYGEMQKSIEGLKKLGVVIDPKKGTIALPNGSFLSAREATDAGKLSATLGSSVSQDAVNSGMKSIMTKAQEKTASQMKEHIGTDSNTLDGGGGSHNSGGESYADTSSAAGASAKNVAMIPERAPSAKITLKKQFGDSFIGDASENIFGMVNNRFKLKDSENYFIQSTPSVNK